MRAALLISGRMYGGGQKIVLDLLRELRSKNGLDIRLVLLGCREPELERAASHIVPYDGRYNRLSTLLLSARRLRTHLSADRPDVLHTHGWDADVIGWLALLGTRIRHLVHLHVTPEWLDSRRRKHQFRRFLTRRVLARPRTQTIAVSSAVRAHWAEHLPWDPASVAVVHNAVNPARFPSTIPGAGQRYARPTLGTAARLEPMKGIEYLLDAMVKLTAEHPGLRLRVAGEGSLKESLQNRIIELGLARNVEFLGHVQDMRSFYHSIDVLVLPSIHTEGLPLAILEAMAAELTIVATTVGGTPEVVRDGVDGLLVPPEDSQALGNAIARLLADPSLRQRMGGSANERVRSQFSMARCANAVFELYRGHGVESFHR